MKLMIGITTYNRVDVIKQMASSLYSIEGIEDCNVRVYDDCSDEYDVSYLESIFPTATIVRQEKNLKSHGNIKCMYEDFLGHGDDYLLTADSDLIFRPDVLHIIKALMPDTDGVLSLYNSNKHKVISNLSVNNIDLVEKHDIGSAGTVFTRKRVTEIVENIKIARGFDWAWSKYFVKNNVRLLVTDNSYAQHIGLLGLNNNGVNIDYGRNFIPVGEVNIGIASKFFEYYICEVVDKSIKRRVMFIRIRCFITTAIIFAIINLII